MKEKQFEENDKVAKLLNITDLHQRGKDKQK